MLLLALNEAFDKKSINILLALDKQGVIRRVTGNGVIQLAALVASDMIQIQEYSHKTIGTFQVAFNQTEEMYAVTFTEKGRILVANWKKGDQESAVSLA
jgi:hypothetical protein